MKKILLLFLLSSIYGIGNTQTSWYPSAGVNISTISSKNENYETKRAIGFNAGLTVQKKITDDWAVNLLLQATQKGYNAEQPFLDGTYGQSYIYTDLLPTIEYYVLDNISVQMGLNLGFLTYEYQKTQTGIEQPFSSSNLVDFGYATGLSIYMNRIKLSAFINNGISNIDTFRVTNENGDPIGTTSLKNSVIHFSLGYKI